MLTSLGSIFWSSLASDILLTSFVAFLKPRIWPWCSVNVMLTRKGSLALFGCDEKEHMADLSFLLVWKCLGARGSLGDARGSGSGKFMQLHLHFSQTHTCDRTRLSLCVSVHPSIIHPPNKHPLSIYYVLGPCSVLGVDYLQGTHSFVKKKKKRHAVVSVTPTPCRA